MLSSQRISSAVSREEAEEEVASLLLISVDAIREFAASRVEDTLGAGHRGSASAAPAPSHRPGFAGKPVSHGLPLPDMFAGMRPAASSVGDGGTADGSAALFGFPAAPELGGGLAASRPARRPGYSSGDESDVPSRRRRGFGSAVSAGGSTVGPSASQLGVDTGMFPQRAVHRGHDAGAAAHDDVGALDPDDVRAALSLDPHLRKPLVMHAAPNVTCARELTLCDDLVLYAMRGMDTSNVDCEVAPGEYGEVAMNSIMTMIGDAASDDSLAKPEYPFPVVMTESVALALVSSSWGCPGPTGVRNKTDWTYDSIGLVVNDLQIPDPDDESWVHSAVATQGFAPSKTPLPRHKVSIVPEDRKFKTWYKRARAEA